MADATEPGLTLAELKQETAVLDGLGAEWRVEPYSIWGSAAGVRLTVYQLHAILSPLRRVPPPAQGVWRAKHDDGCELRRTLHGSVQMRFDGGPWNSLKDGSTAQSRIIAALAEGREPDPSLAERVEVENG